MQERITVRINTHWNTRDPFLVYILHTEKNVMDVPDNKITYRAQLQILKESVATADRASHSHTRRHDARVIIICQCATSMVVALPEAMTRADESIGRWMEKSIRRDARIIVVMMRRWKSLPALLGYSQVPNHETTSYTGCCVKRGARGCDWANRTAAGNTHPTVHWRRIGGHTVKMIAKKLTGDSDEESVKKKERTKLGDWSCYFGGSIIIPLKYNNNARRCVGAGVFEQQEVECPSWFQIIVIKKE